MTRTSGDGVRYRGISGENAMAVDRHPYPSRRARLIPIAFVPYSLAHADGAAGKRGFVTIGCAA